MTDGTRRWIAIAYLLQVLLASVPHAQNVGRLMALREAVARSTPRSLNAQVLAAFQLSHDIKVIDAAGAVLPIINGKRRLSLAFSTSNGDVFVADSRSSQEGSVLMVYYAGSDLVLRAVASGTDYGDLQVVPAAEQAGTFAEAIQIFERLVPPR